MADYQRAASEAIMRFGGEVMRYVGDGIMAFFGYPVAHENDAERAARAGLAILDGVAKLNESQSGRPKLSLRIGIDSGSVVVGTGAGQAVDAFGDAANIAARVQSAAAPDTVVVTGATHRLISGLFVVEDRGAQTLKGIERPVQLHRVVRPSGVSSRFEAAIAAGGLTPFVGREDELRLLMSRWERAREGEGQVALIIGEAGIGKSRLVRRFHEQIAGRPHSWLEAGAGAFFQNTPFYPVVEMLGRLLGDGAIDEQLAQLETRLAAACLKPAEAIPLLAPMLNLPPSEKYPASTLPPEQQRKRLLAILVKWLLGATRAQPLITVIEDLHWVDPSTLELIQLLTEQGATAPLLLIYTARPEFRPPWMSRAHHTQLTLNRLSARDVRAMVAEVAAAKALSDATITTVVERTGGVPLFVEELTRAVLERGDAPSGARDIPTTLHDSLMARLDRLGPAKDVAQVGAVIGSEFSYGLLHAVHPVAESELERSVRRLIDAELVYARGMAPDATYQFKHALIRDVAYEALLKSRRKELHLTVARRIEEQFPALKDAHPEVLAQHWTEAGEAEMALNQWAIAGKLAESRNAFAEALECYQQAVALSRLLPASNERDLRELEIRQLALIMLRITKGFSAPEVFEAVEHAVALAKNSGNIPQLADWVMSRCLPAYIAGDLPAARLFCDQALELALQEGAPLRLANVYTLQMLARCWSGDLTGAEEHFNAGHEFFDDADFRQSPRGGAVVAFGTASGVAWMLGHPDAAREREAQMKAAAVGNKPQNVAFAKFSEAFLRTCLGEYDQAEGAAALALAVSEKHQLSYFLALSQCVLGHAQAQLGRTTDGLALIRQGLAGLLETGSRLGITRHYAWLALAQKAEGATAHAVETIELALQANATELVYRPEILRIRGELRLESGKLKLAESDFREAIRLAQSMMAKAWELRTTMSLSRALRDNGRGDEARAMLANVYNWFTEGFDTADLKDAKALLGELSN